MNRAERRSKLEMYIEILKALYQRGSLKITHLMYKTNINCEALKKFLDPLCEQNLVEFRIVKKKKTETTLYSITQRGKTTLECFVKINLFFENNNELKTTQLFIEHYLRKQ